VKDDEFSRLLARLLATPAEERQEHWRRLRGDLPAMADLGRRRAALRFFLQKYREFEPELLGSLAALGDSWRSAEGVDDWLGEVGRLRDLAERFHLPPTIDVATECMTTLGAWRSFQLPRDRWHFETHAGRSVEFPYFPARRYDFTFSAPGWDTQAESLGQAKVRIRAALRAAVDEHFALWRSIEQAHRDLHAFIQSTHAKERRDIRWLAEKQATAVSSTVIADREKCTKDAVRRAVQRAALIVGLPLQKLRHAPAGRPRKPRSRK
jgi:hypothetical protein